MVRIRVTAATAKMARMGEGANCHLAFVNLIIIVHWVHLVVVVNLIVVRHLIGGYWVGAHLVGKWVVVIDLGDIFVNIKFLVFIHVGIVPIIRLLNVWSETIVHLVVPLLRLLIDHVLIPLILIVKVIHIQRTIA